MIRHISARNIQIGGIVAIWALICGVYIGTNSFPAGKGGLYFTMAQQLASNSFIYPVHIEGYFVDNFPFAYPPIGIYFYAVSLRLGLSINTTGFVLPAILLLLAAVVVFYIARSFCTHSIAPWMASVVFLTSPLVHNGKLTAAGVTRLSGIIFMLLTVWATYRSFHDQDVNQRRWLVYAGISWGLTILSHPVSALHAAIGVAVLYEVNRGDGSGLIDSAIIAGTGLLVASPWLLHVLINFGPSALTGAADSYNSGLFASFSGLIELFFKNRLVVQIYSFLIILGGVFQARRNKIDISVWVILSGLIYSGGQVYVFASILAGTSLAEFAGRIKDAYETNWPTASDRTVQAVRVITVAMVVIPTLILGVGHVAHSTGSSFDHHITQEDREAIEALPNTDTPIAAPVEIGEWITAYTEHPLVRTQKGTEWMSGGRIVGSGYPSSIVFCNSAECYINNTDKSSPQYISYIRGGKASAAEFRESSNWRLVYHQDGIIIARFLPDSAENQRDREAVTGLVGLVDE